MKLENETTEQPVDLDGVFQTPVLNDRHVIDTEDDEENSGPFKCDKCQKKFFNLYVLQRHQLVNSQCQNNEQKTVPAVTVGNKISGEHGTFPCTECTQSFQTRSLLNDHIKSVHSKSSAQDQLGSSGDSLKKLNSESKFHTFKLSKLPRCPLCSMSFRNIRGLRAHKWQAHSEGRNKGTQKGSNEAQEQAECESSEETNPVETKDTKKDHLPAQTMSDVNIGSDYVSHSASLKVKDISEDISIILPENPSEHTAKFFKCDKCGKAFSAKEQLENHKTKAKSRPFRCALCCSGFWTENQLQQHFIWHDKIRGTLPNELRLRINAATAIAASVYSADRAISTLNDPVLISDDKALHECQNCGKGFLSPTSLEKHKREYCNTGSYHCSSCPSTFSDIQELIEHHQECAAAVQTGGCKLCDKLYFYLHAYKKHKKMHKLESEQMNSPYNCPKCGCAFSTQEDLINHRKLNKTSRPYSCAECGKRFSQIRNYRDHLRAHARHKAKPRCRICLKSFVNEADLKYHLSLNHFEDKFYECDRCKRVFTNVESCQHHIEFTCMRKVKCEKCGRFFPKEKLLRRHLESKTCYAKLKCADCPKIFTKKNALLKHSFSHLGLLPYTCVRCRCHFRLARLYLRHQCKPQSIHCVACLREFLNDQDFQQHKKDTGCWGNQDHKGDEIRCLECGQRFETKDDLKKHAGAHQRVLKCAECGKGFRSALLLMSHMGGHAGQSPCLCQSCGLGFPHQQSYDSHLKTCGQASPPTVSNKYCMP
uniref:C2H2-type domain-containing protein n=1 Tax=Periophthalmus magnuspinnatus TaxID=409849 RepID=A0A3B4AHJ3_9GOBI